MLFRAIPTRVGKSTYYRTAERSGAGHPHAGGEIPEIVETISPRVGPSPRGWGNPRRGSIPHQLSRAIPTRVGKSQKML